MSDAFATRPPKPRQMTVTGGDRFGRLLVVQEVRVHGRWSASCKCDCGNETVVTLSNLKSGQTRACGCLQSERAASSNTSRATHGLSSHEHYSRWYKMIQRCQNPQDPKYKDYGARGLQACHEWQDPTVFIGYIEKTLGPRPKGYTLDRIDNNGHYEPGNVRWANPLTQRHNQRRGASWGAV